MSWLANEIATHHVLQAAGSTLAPALLGYASEESRVRIIGFLAKETKGRIPEEGDLGVCQEALRQLHDFNIIHSDLNKFNIVIADGKPKFIDFEASNRGIQREDLNAKEKEGLERKLLDDSGIGKP